MTTQELLLNMVDVFPLFQEGDLVLAAGADRVTDLQHTRARCASVLYRMKLTDDQDSYTREQVIDLLDNILG